MNLEKAAELVKVHGTPTLFLSARTIRENYRSLAAALPGVELYYALKANEAEAIVPVLHSEGGRFDVASNFEIDLLRAHGIDPSRCIHTHPIKRDADIRYALDFGIRLFVADNAFELEKFLPYRGEARVLVRMAIENPQSLVNLSHKFGAGPLDVFDLIQKAHQMGLSVAGISFHCGSQSEHQAKYIEALEYCRQICRQAALAEIPLEIIDIGGGFPVNYLKPVLPISQFCQPIMEHLDRYFANYRIIAEPGRYIAATAMTLVASVVGKSMRKGVCWYYLDDGLYGSFSGKLYDHSDYPMVVQKTGERQPSILAGPTCDSIDVLYENIHLPELDIGDLLLFETMGAYTSVSATNFNGYPKTKIVVIDTDPTVVIQ
jgi:ornithine decarboxylase